MKNTITQARTRNGYIITLIKENAIYLNGILVNEYQVQKELEDCYFEKANLYVKNMQEAINTIEEE